MLIMVEVTDSDGAIDYGPFVRCHFHNMGSVLDIFIEFGGF